MRSFDRYPFPKKFPLARCKSLACALIAGSSLFAPVIALSETKPAKPEMGTRTEPIYLSKGSGKSKKKGEQLGRQRQIFGEVLDIKGRVESYTPARSGSEAGGLQLEESETEVRIGLNADILFEYNKYDILKEAEPTLAKLAAVLKRYPGAHILVEGHTDSHGNDNYNEELSGRRAGSVKRWLIEKGSIPREVLASKGSGEKKPIAPNQMDDGSDNPDGRRRNRRVEILVTKAGVEDYEDLSFEDD